MFVDIAGNLIQVGDRVLYVKKGWINSEPFLVQGKVVEMSEQWNHIVIEPDGGGFNDIVSGLRCMNQILVTKL